MRSPRIWIAAAVALLCGSLAAAQDTGPLARGDWAISGFADGAYRLSAHRLGYVEAGPFAEPATQSVTVAARQHLDNLTLRLRRAVILTGTIVDEYGDPVDGISVYAQKIQYGSDGVRTAASVSVIPDRTNDLGQFRLFGLPPGDDLISAPPPMPRPAVDRCG